MLVWACSEPDRAELISRYGLAPDRVVIVPNGAAPDELRYRTPSERLTDKRRLRLQQRFQALFIASWHQPNIAAARR